MKDSLEKEEAYRFISDITLLVELYNDFIPQGYPLFKEKKISTYIDLLDVLIKIFEVEEKQIEVENSKSFVTPIYEDNVRRFACELCKKMISKFDELKEYDDYMLLMGQKHIAYGFFHGLYKGEINQPKDIDSRYVEILYLGLINFYKGFYGRFADNEEAIILMCNYYPNNIELKNNENIIATTLYNHISNAGTPTDMGYAFNGIALIEQYINKLPVELVQKLIRCYSLFGIINNKIIRHQLYALINSSKMSDTEKKEMKFWSLDSILIADYFNKFLLEKMQKEGRSVNIYYSGLETGLKDEVLKVFNEPITFWDNNEFGNRKLLINGNVSVKVELQDEDILIDYEKNRLKMKYEYSDWQLGSSFQKDIDKRIKESIVPNAILEDEDNQMTFSLLYLDQYRGLSKQIVDFDHAFCFDIENNKVTKNSQNINRIKGFYGKSIYSLSCVVGKNGTGKTSIVDFLRETFFKLIKIIGETEISCREGYIKEADYKIYNILDSEAKFFVVFKLGKSPYFLTNIENVGFENVEPFHKLKKIKINEFSKVIFFSNMLKANQENIFFENAEKMNDVILESESQLNKTLNNFRTVDYSETESYIRKYKSIAAFSDKKEVVHINSNIVEKPKRRYINRDFLCQLLFFHQIESAQICNYLDIELSKKFYICSKLKEGIKDCFTLEEIHQEEVLREFIEKYAWLPDVQINYFSSGQYAKCSFLSKLNWFLSGYKKEERVFHKIFEPSDLDSDEVLQDGETTLIFIDEGELYYHPEWQRRYISTLLEFINNIQAKVQIILTTNSPFILSDILQEDVIYLSSNKEKEFDQTLGQNIHRLLIEDFFMDYTIGEYAKNYIQDLMDILQDRQKYESYFAEKVFAFNKDIDEYERIRLLINQIGEPVYRYNLEKLLESSPIMEKKKRVQELEAEKRILEEKIALLKEGDTSDKN